MCVRVYKYLIVYYNINLVYMLEVSIVEGLYIMYMFIYFKTRFSLELNRSGNILRQLRNMKFLFHPVERSKVPISQICQFGKVGSVFIFLYLILREFVSLPKYTNLIVFLIIFVLTLINYNALLYMMPVFILELYMNRNKLKNLFSHR